MLFHGALEQSGRHYALFEPYSKATKSTGWATGRGVDRTHRPFIGYFSTKDQKLAAESEPRIVS